MRSKFSNIQWREFLWLAIPAVILLISAFWLASAFVQPGPPKSIAIATASKGSPYYTLGERYAKVLAANGVQLLLRETGGSIDNLKALNAPASDIDAAFLQGGLTSAKEAPDLLTIGRLFYEPIWMFYRGSETLERLTQLKGKRVLVGPPGSGTNALAMKLLAANGITAANSTLITMEMPDYVESFKNETADAGFLVLAPEARTVQRLFRAPNVRLMSMAQADALTQRYPFLSKLMLRQGVVDFDANIPPADTVMIATTTQLVVRNDLHPALVNLLTQAAVSVHGQPITDPNGNTRLFERVGEFPNVSDIEFPVADEARSVYKTGAPFLQRYVPFWIATLVNRMIILAVPLLGVLFPIVRFVPMIYSWRVRRRILYWYRELKSVEQGLDGSIPEPSVLTEKQREIERIEEAVNQIPVPLGFSDKLYELRSHIDMVRRRLAINRAAISVPTPTS